MDGKKEQLPLNEVIIESNIEISQNDFDLIIMFFESKKQSGGGDSSSHEFLSNKKCLKLAYEDPEAKNRILKKKFFTFKNYLLRSFESDTLGYKFDKYEPLKSQLIIKDLLIDTDTEDLSIVRLYAEHLAPDNDILHLSKSNLFENTFYVEYKEDLDKEKLQSRYNKKPKLRNKQINLLDSLRTNSFLISSTKLSQSFDQIRLKVIEEIEKRETKQQCFIDLSERYVLFQLENDSILNDLIDSITLYIKAQNNGFIIEKCFNFSLLDSLVKNPKIESVIPSKIVEKTDSNIQTETTVPEKKESKKEKKPSEVKKETKQSEKKVPLDIADEIKVEEVQMDNFCLGNIIKSETDKEISLNEEAPLSIALKNCAQLRIDLDKSLKPLNTEFNYNKKNKFKILSIKCDQNSKQKIIDLLKNFAKMHFSYKIVHLPSKIANDQKLMEMLLNYIPNLNKQYPAVYLEVKNSLIHSYGYPRSLDRVLEKNCQILNDLISKKKEETPQKPQVKMADRKKEAQPSQILVDNENESQENQTEEGFTRSGKKFRSDTLEASLNSNNIVLFNSCEPIDIPIEKSEIIQNLNVVVIDPKEFKSLSVCLQKCYQITLDFMNDIKMISPLCQLILIEDQSNNRQLNGVLINSTEDNYIQCYKDQIMKLMTFYEKNRLKHVYIMIDEKLKLDQAFKELIENFNSKNELNDLRIILEMIYNTDKVVHVQLIDKSIIEIYGYTNAVQNFDTFVYEILNKTINKINNNLNNMLAFKVSVKDNPKLAVFFKFDGIYFNDLALQLTGLDAYGVKLEEQEAIHLACLNKKLKNNPKKLEKLDEIKDWRKNIDDYINHYVDNFCFESIEMPFGRNSDECKSILYDKNTLDIAWINEEKIEVFGLKEEIEKFKQKILN